MKVVSVLLIFSIALLYGCNASSQHTVSTQSNVPTLDKPSRPQLQAMTGDELAEYNKLSAPVREKLQDNDTELKRYAEKLEVTVDAYNSYAKIHNSIAAGTPSGSGPSPVIGGSPPLPKKIGGGR